MDYRDEVKKACQDLVDKLGIVAQISVDTDENGAYRVNIESQETGLLIGYHGRTLESLQIILGLLMAKKLGVWIKAYLNVGDYREKREEALMHMAQRAAERVLSTGRPVEISKLTSAERRVIHLTLAGDERLTTESFGSGLDRVLIVKPKDAV